MSKQTAVIRAIICSWVEGERLVSTQRLLELLAILIISYEELEARNKRQARRMAKMEERLLQEARE